jgi:hypothetical protein
MGAQEIKSILNLVPELLKVPFPRIWTYYDELERKERHLKKAIGKKSKIKV